MNLSDIIDRVVELSEKVHAYYAVELPKRHPNYPLVNPGDEEAPPPHEEVELKEFLEALSDDAIDQLILIVKVGWGEFGVDELAEAYEELRGTFSDPELAVSYLMGKGALADELSVGVEVLRKHKINIDKMPLKKVKVRRR